MYRGSANQIRLSPTVVNDFLRQVDFGVKGDDEALRIRPGGKGSSIVIDPRVHSGAATVNGVRTERLAERAEGFGQTPEE